MTRHVALIISLVWLATLAGGCDGRDAPVAEATLTEAGPVSAPIEVEQHAHTNRLVDETSPYLLQHAHNPVDWHPWGPEAFEAARAADKPIFLSIGYSTCYWCHVMERESFEDEATAAVMNELFICVKLDREERPDVDDIYMAAVQSLTGRGGWPMSLFLDPVSLKPFLGGTYYPPEPRYNKPSFVELMRKADDAWRNHRSATQRTADQIGQQVQSRLSAISQRQHIDRQQVDIAVANLVNSHDTTYGGFGSGRTKFPMPGNLELLMAVAWDEPDAQSALRHTLDRMAMGGIYDQVGGGFHRYSTDRRWLVPHFEKMLYDNAQLATVYARAYTLTGDEFYAEIVRETLDYVLREMTGPGGGFFSAQDAEVNAHEGASYVWSESEFVAALEAAGLRSAAPLAREVYGLDGGANFRDPHHPHEPAKYVLHLRRRPDASADARSLPRDEFTATLRRINEALLSARDGREQPGTDDKVLTAWNGLMITAMVDGAEALAEDRYLEAAQRAARFVLSTMRAPDGGLYRTWRADRAQVDGFLEDYAFLVRGLLSLHRVTGDREWLDEAIELMGVARARFHDGVAGGWFNTLDDQDDLFVRTKTTRDGVVPTGAAVMLHNLIDLHAITGEDIWLDQAIASLRAVSYAIRRQPVSTVVATAALARLGDTGLERVASPVLVPAPPADPVHVTPSASTVNVAPGTPATLTLSFRIDEGFHINAHEPGKAGLVGLGVRLVGGSGLALEVEYPPGLKYRGEVFIHSGVFTVTVRIVQTGPVVGNSGLMALYQVCTDRACLPSTGTLLPVTIVGTEEEGAEASRH